MGGSDKPSLRLTSVTVASPDPRRLAGFYAKLLGVDVGTAEPPRAGEPENAGWAQLKTANITLNFEFEEQWQTPRWPARNGEQTATQHLDIRVVDLETAVEWASTCGARLADEQPQDRVRVMFDPAGHPFCLFL